MSDALAHSADDRPALAMVCNTLTPYRVHLHELLASRIPELKLVTAVTHGPAEFDWRLDIPKEINVKFFARGHEPANAGLMATPWTDWRKGRDLIRYCDEQRTAAVILTSYGYPSHLRLVGSLSRHRIPFFLRSDSNIHIDDLRSPVRLALKRMFFAWASRRAAGAMPMGEYGIAYFEKYGFPRERMYRVPYTPDYDWFARRDEDAIAGLRRRFELDPARRRLMYSGRLHPVKRVDLLIDAFGRIAAERPNWDVLIVGSGTLENELRTRIPESLQTRFKWTGFVEADELRAAYHACDALVLPSAQEAWAVVVQEAMAAGMPVIASHVVGAAKDLVHDGVSGRIFRSGDLDDLTAALRDVTDDSLLPKFRSAAPCRLAAWRAEVDVVSEIRRALVDAQVLKAPNP